MRPGGRSRASLAALVLVSFGACKGNADFSDAMPAPVILNAEEYRREITAIDQLAFDEQPLLPARRTSLGKELEDLAGRVKASSDSRFLLIESLELRRLAQIARAFPPDRPKTMLQNQWMRIRNNLFEDRSWFARSAADLDAERPRIAR